MKDIDTIAAISTALGNGGIHIIRISGEDSFTLVEKFFKKGKKMSSLDIKSVKSHTIHYGFVVDSDGNPVDEVMVSFFIAPHSYTAENVVEVNCHGGTLAVKKVLDIILKAGARLAMPGEFTKRAFLNGRIDLSQAESVMGIINSESEYALKASVNHLRGNIKSEILDLREIILYEMAYIEAALDDPEHYDLSGYSDELLIKVNNVLDRLDKLSKSYKNGRIIKEGINTVIVGKPNVGKSSFMNFIMKEDMAIVTDIPGTTRDIIEHTVHLDGINLNLMDTAGIHETNDIVESIGVEKSINAIKNAELVICIIDSSRLIDSEDEHILTMFDKEKSIILLNKSDIVMCDNNINEANEKFIIDLSENGYRIVSFSTKTGNGYESFRDYIMNMFFNNDINIHNETFITSERHMEALRSAIESLKLVISNISYMMPEDLLIIDLMDAFTALGEITGETVSDSLIDKIFSEFCMGK